MELEKEGVDAESKRGDAKEDYMLCKLQSSLNLLMPTFLRGLAVCKKLRVWPNVPKAENYRDPFYRLIVHILGS